MRIDIHNYISENCISASDSHQLTVSLAFSNDYIVIANLGI